MKLLKWWLFEIIVINLFCETNQNTQISWIRFINFKNSDLISPPIQEIYFKNQLGSNHQTKVYKIGICCFSAKHVWWCVWVERHVYPQIVVSLQCIDFIPPTIILTSRYNWNIVESGVKHHDSNPNVCDLELNGSDW